MASITIADVIANAPPWLASLDPWHATNQAPNLIEQQLTLLPSGYKITSGIAIHETATVEAGAQLKSPVIIGPGCFVAATTLLRGGVWLEENVIIGPSCEVKTCFILAGSKTAHLNFVGDSVIGRDVNIEAGAVIANYRNERDDKNIRIRHGGGVIDTGVTKFGAIVGDHVRIGANAVIAPGAIVSERTIVRRLELVDQS